MQRSTSFAIDALRTSAHPTGQHQGYCFVENGLNWCIVRN